MYEKPEAQFINKSIEKEIDFDILKTGVEGAIDSLDHYKEMPDVELIPDENNSYKSQDPDEVEAKQANKYRKVAFGTIANYLQLILMQIDGADEYEQQLNTLLTEISEVPRVTKDLIDRFDTLAFIIIKDGKKLLEKK